MPPASLSCASRVSRVVVYARGAMVTRQVDLPPLPEGEVELRIPGVTPFAEPGAVRAELRGGRRVDGIRARLVIPERAEGGGESRAELRELERERAGLDAQIEALSRRRKKMLGLRPRLALQGRSRRTAPAARVADALALDALVDAVLGDLDARLLELERRREHNQRTLEAARLAFAQAGTAARAVAGHPTREVVLSLSGSGPIESLELTYPVSPARWWPAYSARLSSGGRHAELSLEAFVAQSTFEDWSDVRLGLCTADMIQEIALPELASLRLGRAQPPRPLGFRAPPQGLDALFASYDQTASARQAPAPSLPPPPEPEPAADLEYDGAADEGAELEVSRSISTAMPRPSKPMAAMAAMAPPAPMRARAAPEKKKERRASRRADLEECEAHAPSLGGSAPGGGPGAAQRPEDGLEPGDWLDFDALRIAAADEPRRGRLVRSAGSVADLLGISTREVLEAPGPAHAVDPLFGRGSFDHRLDAEGLADVASNGRPHRLTIARASAAARQRLCAVPREAPEVYREAALDNPFAAPLLGGPVDVFLDGALLSNGALAAVDRGGEIRLGLGVEERVKVARNARAEESTRGVLGGKTAVEHRVEIEASSALGFEAELELLDRIPVTDDKEVEVSLVASDPKAEKYDQSDRGRPVRGGLRWRLKLAPGGKAVVVFTYTVELPSKSELQGGNRRD